MVTVHRTDESDSLYIVRYMTGKHFLYDTAASAITAYLGTTEDNAFVIARTLFLQDLGVLPIVSQEEG